RPAALARINFPMLPTEILTCVHFGVCGGCLCQPSSGGPAAPAAYAEELRAKEARVRELLKAFDVADWRSIVPSPQEWHYRNKMEFAGAVGWDDPGLVLGLRQAGRFDRVVDLQSCLLMSAEAVEILRRVRTWAKAHDLG